MRLLNSYRPLLFVIIALATLSDVASSVRAQSRLNPPKKSKSTACSNDDSGLKLPAGFCATVFADGIGHARHMVVWPSGVVYVNTWSGDYYGSDKPHEGGFLVALQDKSGTGKANVIERFGETVQSGGAGGTGIGIYKGSIYAEINDRIVRYLLPAGALVPMAIFGTSARLGNNMTWIFEGGAGGILSREHPHVGDYVFVAVGLDFVVHRKTK